MIQIGLEGIHPQLLELTLSLQLSGELCITSHSFGNSDKYGTEQILQSKKLLFAWVQTTMHELEPGSMCSGERTSGMLCPNGVGNT